MQAWTAILNRKPIPFATNYRKKGFKNDLRGTDDLISTYDLHDYLVVDFGSEITKVGFSGVDYPKIISPTIVGVPNNENDTDLTATKL